MIISNKYEPEFNTVLSYFSITIVAEP